MKLGKIIIDLDLVWSKERGEDLVLSYIMDPSPTQIYQNPSLITEDSNCQLAKARPGLTGQVPFLGQT